MQPSVEAIRRQARSLGFDACAVASADGAEGAGEGLKAWLKEGRHGDMAWMAETLDRRIAPKALWPDARSVIMLAMNYGPDEDPLTATRLPAVGAVSVYARHRDYHDVIKGKLKLLASWLIAQSGEGDAKVFVDTAPVMEKPLASRAGLGWQGKHTNLVSREHGSWLFLGSLFTNLVFPPDAPEHDHCGSCRACLDACPTAAFPAPYQLDARRCISYLTIEHRGPIPRELRPLIGNRIYGCDDCLAVCPWNKFAKLGSEAKLQARDDLKRPALAELVALDDAGFRKLFAGGPIKRIGYVRFMRNVLIAIGNSEDVGFLPAVIGALDAEAALIRSAAVWALWRLAPEEGRARAAEAKRGEDDEEVREEWDDPFSRERDSRPQASGGVARSAG